MAGKKTELRSMFRLIMKESSESEFHKNRIEKSNSGYLRHNVSILEMDRYDLTSKLTFTVD